MSQFVTLGLHDALPRSAWLEAMRKEQAHRADAVEDGLDRGYGECVLREERAARIMEQVLLFGARESYELLAWCVMPNHLHMLIVLRPGKDLALVMQRMKSFSAHEINKVLGRKGPVWRREYFDRFMRDAKHEEVTICYIEQNPVRAGLAPSAPEWRWGSAWKGYRRNDG
ncbi:MAG TPA: transposase [Planctomycetota bacterium]|nr:transposase [Planctomycetota bacterium]